MTEKTAVQIRDEIAQHIKPNDRVLVMHYGEGAAWLGFPVRMPDVAGRQSSKVVITDVDPEVKALNRHSFAAASVR